MTFKWYSQGTSRGPSKVTWNLSWPESYYKHTLSVSTVECIIQELREIFSGQHPENAYFSYPYWWGSSNSTHQKGIMLTYTQGTFSILRVSQLSLTVEESRGNTWKSIALHSTIYEALHLPNVKFFPNLYSLLKVLCFPPVMRVENECYENG